MSDIDSIAQWFNGDVPDSIPDYEVLEGFHALHPRTIFLKGLPAGARVLDMGAGDGSMQLFRMWLTPARADLEMYAHSLEKGIHFDSYDGFEIGNWDEQPPSFEGHVFDAVFSAHFIEHIQDPRAYFEWASSRLAPGGRIYTEWPSERALRAPTRSELQSRGIDLFLGNFYDDLTHRTFPPMQRILRAIRQAGLEVEAAGTIRLPLYEAQLLGIYRRTGDPAILQHAYWSHTGWCQYLVAQKAAPGQQAPESEKARPGRQEPESGLAAAGETLPQPQRGQDASRLPQAQLQEEIQRRAGLAQQPGTLQNCYSQLLIGALARARAKSERFEASRRELLAACQAYEDRLAANERAANHLLNQRAKELKEAQDWAQFEHQQFEASRLELLATCDRFDVKFVAQQRRYEAAIDALNRRLGETENQRQAALREIDRLRAIISFVRQSRWVKLGRSIKIGPNLEHL
jgi:SAM-dependent methyltransferase/cell division septum initiation protein DivIVA